MDLVDEQHVARLQIGEQRREIARPRDHRPGGGAEADAELARDDLRQRRLAEAGRAVQQHVVERLAPRPRRLDEDAAGCRAARPLADEVVERRRPQAGFGAVAVARCAVEQRRGRRGPAAASASVMAAAPSAGQFGEAAADQRLDGGAGAEPAGRRGDGAVRFDPAIAEIDQRRDGIGRRAGAVRRAAPATGPAPRDRRQRRRPCPSAR